MEEDGDGGGEDLTPFWVQSTTNLRRSDRLRRGVAAVFFSSGLVVFLLLVTAAFFLAFVVPSTISLSANIFKPNSVKKSWDSLNIVLVLVAVVFGFLSRNRNEERSPLFDESQPSPIKENQSQNSNHEEKSSLYDYPQEKSNLYDYPQEKSSLYDYHQEKSDLYEQRNLNLRRSSSSYPDLREFSSSSTNWSYGDYQRRFFDDFNVDSSRSSDAAELHHHHRRHRSLEQVDYLASPPQIKTVVVDTLVYKPTGENFPAGLAAAPPGEEEVAKRVVGDGAGVREGRSSRRFYKDLGLMNPVSAPKPPLPPAEEAPPPEFQESEKRSRERAARKKERSSRRQIYKDAEPTNPIVTPLPPPPPPPQQKSSNSERRRGGAAANSTKVFLNSLYSKKKKQRQKSADNMDSLLHEAPPPLSFQIPPPSPPPPPPPPPPQPSSVFHSLFSSKKPKRKRTITVTVEPLPPSPPPESPPHAAARDPEPNSHAPPPPSHKPPKPLRMNNFDRLEEASNSGGESPFRRIPPPPPPPPPSLLKTPAWRFLVQGDYVRVNSSNSSRSGSPELEETDSDVTPSAEGGGGVAALFCPSPDVDTKAESFISNFRAKLKLEKIHSMKKRDVGPSTLGPGPGPNKI